MSSFFNDVKYAVRQLRTRPGFTAVVMITLALGIGANTALFSVLHAVLLTPLPYHDPGRLFKIFDQSVVDAGNSRLLSVPELYDIRTRQRSLVGIAALRNGAANLSLPDGAERLSITRVSSNLFSLLGVQPMLGRGFVESEEQVGAERVVVLSHGLWSSRFGESKDVIGRAINLNGEAHSVIGVMPAGFSYPYDGVAMWTPLRLGGRDATNRRNHCLFTLARLKSGISSQQAEQDLLRIRQEVKADIPDAYTEMEKEKFGLTSLHESSVGRVRRPLLILMGGALLVLLLACVNVANLLLVRASVRQKEISLRMALGAGRRHIFGQLLLEGTLLSGLGSLCGLLLAALVLKAIVLLAPEGIPRIAEVRINGTVILFALVTCAIVAMGISFTPVFKIFRSRLAGIFRSLAGRTESRTILRLREALATSQIAISMLLLVSAGLLLQSFWHLLRDDLGFEIERTLTFKVYPPAQEYPEKTQVDQLYQRLFAKLETTSGIESVGGVSNIPLNDEWNSTSVLVKGIADPQGQAEARIDIGVRHVRSDYFGTMGIQLLHGRLFAETDSRDTQPVVIVDEQFTRRLFSHPGEALGHQMSFPGDADWGTIVGVVRTVKHYGPGVESQPEVYIPQSQSSQRGMFVAVRTAIPPESLVPAIRADLAELDAGIPIANLATQESRLAGIVQKPRFMASLLTSFAVLALLLAAVGTFGVISYSVRQRTREFGIRFALGAQKRDVMRLVLKRVGWMLIVGILVGIGCAFATTRLMVSLLFGVTPLDATTIFSASVMVISVTLLGCMWPAIIAARTNPMDVLKYE